MRVLLSRVQVGCHFDTRTAACFLIPTWTIRAKPLSLEMLPREQNERQERALQGEGSVWARTWRPRAVGGAQPHGQSPRDVSRTGWFTRHPVGVGVDVGIDVGIDVCGMLVGSGRPHSELGWWRHEPTHATLLSRATAHSLLDGHARFRRCWKGSSSTASDAVC